MAQLIITAIGPDRPGLVGELTAHLHAAGANILDSRMVNLRGQFALMLLLECADNCQTQLSASAPEVGSKIGLHVSVTQQTSAARPIEGLPYKLKTYSMDQPGIVARLTKVLQTHGVNIEELSARQESAAFAGSPLFMTEMRLTVPPGVAVRKLRDELERLGDSLNCDVDLEPA